MVRVAVEVGEGLLQVEARQRVDEEVLVEGTDDGRDEAEAVCVPIDVVVARERVDVGLRERDELVLGKRKRRGGVA